MNAYHKIFRPTLLALTCLSISGSAFAQVPISIRDCATITGATQRLDCYDAAARSIPPPAAAAPAPAPVVAAVTSARDFGAETMPSGTAPDAAANDDRIQSRLIGSFKGWWPGLRFKLENGQVWQYDGQDEATFGEQQNPLITVRKSAVGSYWLTASGQAAEVQVRRLK